MFIDASGYYRANKRDVEKKTAPRSSIIWNLATWIFATGVLLFGVCMRSPFQAAPEQPWCYPPIILIKLSKHARF